jgi:hypothetical protein
MKNNMENNCVRCCYFKLTIPPAIGRCKMFNTTKMTADYCVNFTKINEMPEILKDNFGGKK